MFKNSKAVTELVVATLALAGVAGTGTGIASADTTPASCQQTAHATRNPGISSFWITHTYDKSVSGASFAPGTQVTYTDVVGTTSIGNPYVNAITDYPPPGFGQPVKASVTAYHLGEGEVTSDVTPQPNNNGWEVTSTGWFVNSGYPVTLSVTYVVPTTLPAGQQVISGGMGVGGTVGVGADIPDVPVCFTLRGPNPGEALLGSADTTGLGSATNQLSSTGSVTTGITNVIKGLIPGSAG